MSEHKLKNSSEYSNPKTVDEDIFNEVNKFLKFKKGFLI